MKNKIGLIITYSVLCVFILAVALCAIIRVDYRPKINLTASEVSIQINDAQVGARNEAISEEADKNNFIEEFNNSFKLTILQALFSGNLNKEATVTRNTSAPSFSDGYKVLFVFDEDGQDLIVNGKPFLIADNSSEAVKYNRMVFNVVENAGFGSVNLYFYANGGSTYYQVTTLANFGEIYKTITNMQMFAN